MKKLIKKILVLGFAVTGMFLSSNKCFADGYDVNVILLGNTGVGKTNIARRLCGKTFNVNHDPTGWADDGVGGYCREYIIGNDTFNCYFFDAPGFLQEDNPDITRQIDLAPISNMSLALVVVDPKDDNHGVQYRNSVQEAFARHAISLQAKSPKCGIVVVINKSDLLSSVELERVEDLIKASMVMYEGVSVNSAIVSAKDKSDQCDAGFGNLENIMKEFLSSNKNNFVHNEKTFFKYCAKCKRKFFPSKSDQGKYCSRDCLLDAEGYLCSYSKCSSRMRNEKFLKNDPGVEEYNGNYYCGDRCLHDDKGKVCGNDKNCPNMRPKLLPYEGVGSYYPKSKARYCDKHCREEKEYHQCPKCLKSFAPNDPDATKGKQQDPTTWYCSEKCRAAAEDGSCCIM